MDVVALAEKLGSLSVPALLCVALIGGVPWLLRLIQKQHDKQLELKDEVIKTLREDRDYWKNIAVASAETSAKSAETAKQQADHVEKMTEILEAVTLKARA